MGLCTFRLKSGRMMRDQVPGSVPMLEDGALGRMRSDIEALQQQLEGLTLSSSSHSAKTGSGGRPEQVIMARKPLLTGYR
jgi:hypothetical protein